MANTYALKATEVAPKQARARSNGGRFRATEFLRQELVVSVRWNTQTSSSTTSKAELFQKAMLA